jgi:NitT/TauT family transport system substrate-binding protein
MLSTSPLAASRTGRLGRRQVVGLAVAAAATALLAACGSDTEPASSSKPATSAPPTAPSAGQTVPIKIGYFPNVTHAPGLVADAEGFFTKRIGEGKVGIQSFNAGPDVIQALFGGSLDISYIGPSPTVTAYAQSGGEAVRVVSGATSGGASLVVTSDIADAAGLRGKVLATPQLGNTQDVALRYWLKEQGLVTTVEGGGDVKIQPQKNSAAVQAFKQGQIDGAWVPEPFASMMIAAGGKELVDERTLWPNGAFVTTNIIVSKKFLDENPDTVRAFLEAHLDANAFIEQNPDKAQADVIAKIKAITDQDTDPAAVASAWTKLSFTADPLADTLKEGAAHADAVGLLEDKPTDDFASLWSLDQINAALESRGKPTVSD